MYVTGMYLDIQNFSLIEWREGGLFAHSQQTNKCKAKINNWIQNSLKAMTFGNGISGKEK